jgi:hypothetical protein
LFCTSAGTAGSADWDEASDTMSWSICAGRVFDHSTVYVFSFDVTNPEAAQRYTFNP